MKRCLFQLVRCNVVALVSLAVLTPAMLSSAVVVGQLRPNKAQINYRTPKRQFQAKLYRGRTYQVEASFVQANPRLVQQVVERLHRNISVVLKKFPDHSTKDLNTVRYFIMHGPDAVGGGRPSGLAFIRSGQPERKQHLDPNWDNSVVIWSGKNYANLTDLWAQKSVAHELAHAYHLHRWPEKQPEILAAYDSAMKEGLYRDVRDIKGTVTKKAYATVNQLEYFAELSAMYFVGCNYEPVNRLQLKNYDPRGFQMIEQMWAVRRGSTAPKSKLLQENN
ncbi:MAG: hypothetical protein ABJZ55_13535 [Fuerstiella sp.]